MRSLTATGFALLGAVLIATSYGLARFAFGLFVPQIRDELALAPSVIGYLGALPFISFVLASLIAPWAADRTGARNTAVLSGLFAVLGLVLIATAASPLALAAGVFACGICTGLMMPALTAAMQALVKRELHGRVSAVMNAGTSIGVCFAVPTVLFLADAWRIGYFSFALLAALATVAAFFLLPSVSKVVPANAAPPPPISVLQWSRLFRLSLFAFLMGFVAAAYWIFAPDLVVTLGELPSSQTAWLWLAVGVAGLSGAVVSDLADRNNPPITHALLLVMLSASLALLAASPDRVFLAAFSALVFGGAYMSLTGLYLLTGIRLLPGRLSFGPVLPFMACAIGQAAGSPVVGLLVSEFGYAGAFSIFSAIGILVAIASPLYPRYLEIEEEVVPEDTGLQAAYDYQLQDEEGEPLVIETEETAEEMVLD